MSGFSATFRQDFRKSKPHPYGLVALATLANTGCPTSGKEKKTGIGMGNPAVRQLEHFGIDFAVHLDMMDDVIDHQVLRPSCHWLYLKREDDLITHFAG